MFSIKCKRAIALLLSGMALLSYLPPLSAVSAEGIDTTSNIIGSVTAEDKASLNDYAQYLAESDQLIGNVESAVAQLKSPDSPIIQSFDGISGAELSAKQKKLTYAVQIDQPGAYQLAVKYYALPGKSKDIVFSLLIDGELPFKEASAISLSRVFKDAGEIRRDSNGNDLRPVQTEVFRWNEALLSDISGYYDDAFIFAFDTAGSKTLEFCYVEEEMILSAVELQPIENLITYKEYSVGAKPAKEHFTLYEAESPFEKSSSMLYPTYDRSDAATSPSHYSKMRYNTIGQSNWSHQGQWISWNINVPEDGWYSISMRARQNYQQGINSYRTLQIDGEVPFAEMKNIEFPYQLGWYMKTLCDDEENPYLFYLTEGEHTLKLTVSAGPMGTVLKQLNEVVLGLNAVYRSIIMVTGSTPDKYRTYYLEESIPGLEEKLKEQLAVLDKLYSEITEITNTSGSQASTIKEMQVMIGDFLSKPLKIPTRISAFKSNIESLGSLILTLGEQALELDYITVFSESELPRVKAGFFQRFSYEIKGFIASFVEDYNSIGSSAENVDLNTALTVWISNGRDQAQILKNLIDNKFTPKTHIGVNLSIVSTAAGTSSSTLVQATLAGKGPDVALFTPKDTPVNLAMRGALAELSRLDGFSDLKSQFYDSAWIPYEYEGGIYGVPETQNYEMLFYRTDIFDELGLCVPDNWEEFYSIIELLQKKHLGVGVMETNSANAGISSGISFFEKMLLQNGGSYYNSELTATEFNTTIAYDAFKKWTELYTEYGLDRTFDFFNRFRTGEMPIGIMGYTQYNQLYAAAPEIRGLWAMAPIPGTVDEKGTVIRTETASGTAAIMLDKCKNKSAAWDFIKWWCNSDIQAGYGTELEASLGVAARYDTANRKAFESIGWSDSEMSLLISQWEQVTDIKQIPGNYFISRCLTNAFRSVVDEEVNYVRALNTYNKDMNAEITRKREEFGLN